MLIQCDPIQLGVGYLRIDFNPARIDIQACNFVLAGLLPGGVQDVRMLAKCTRFDATVDVQGIHPDQLMVYYPKMTVSRSFRNKGHCETLEMGRFDGDKRITVYDKVAKAKHWNEKHAIKVAVPHDPTTRIEIVLRPAAFHDQMLELPDPFSPLSVTSCVKLLGTETDLFRIFISAAQAHGAHDVLLQLSEGNRKGIKNILEKFSCQWWKPKDLWSAWPELVAKTFAVETTCV